MVKMKLKSILIVSVFAVCLAALFRPAYALGLDYYGIEATINDDSTVSNSITFKFDSSTTFMDYNLGFKIYNLSWSSDFQSSTCTSTEKGETSSVSCDLGGITQDKNTLTLKFRTESGITKSGIKYRLSMNYGIPFPVKRVFSIIQLPKNGILSEAATNESYYPGSGETTTDGKHIMVYWNLENITQGDLQFMVSYTLPGIEIFSDYLVLILGLIIAAMVAVAVYIRKMPSSSKAEEKMAVITSVLNKDEKTIINLLKQHEGSVGQKVLVRESDFSKAKVSRLVKALKGRGIVDTEPISGRENRVILRIKTVSSDEKPEQAAASGTPEKQ